MGKGDGRRPPAISDAELKSNWDHTFGNRVPLVPAPTPGHPEVWNIWDGGQPPEPVASEETPTSEA